MKKIGLKWTSEEINMLKDLSSKYNYKKIAEMMGKSEDAIYLKAKKMGIVLIQDRRKWTDEEEIILSELWGNFSLETIAKRLKRSTNSIKIKANKMGLGPMIKNNYEVLTIPEVCELLKVTRDRITGRWKKIGLNIKNKRLTDSTVYLVIKWDDLIDFLKNNQNEWDSRLVEKNMLGEESDWLKEKRKRDIIENPLWYRKWTDEEIKMVEELYKSKKTISQIAKILDRSENSISYMLRNLGYSYKSSRMWQIEELKFLKDNYMNMTYKEISDVLGRSNGAVKNKALKLGIRKIN